MIPSMKANLLRFLSLLFVFTLGTAALPARAEDLNAVKSRMTKRISQIDALKAKGAIGENNRGYLEARGEAPGADAVISAENKDRETVYGAIAKQAGSTAESVGKQRARQLAAASAAGVWVQKENGTWYKK